MRREILCRLLRALNAAAAILPALAAIGAYQRTRSRILSALSKP